MEELIQQNPPQTAADLNLNIVESFLTADHQGFALVDPSFRFIRLNKALAEIYEKDAESLIGRPVVDLVGESNWDLVSSLLLRALAGETILNTNACADKPDSNGVIRQKLASFFPVANDRLILGVGVVVQDVTDRLLGEQAVRESESRYRLLADTVPHLVWMVDSAGHITYVNYRWTDFTGYNLEDTAAAGWPAFLYIGDRSRVEAVWHEARDSGLPFEVECRLHPSDGEPRWFLVRAVPMSDSKGTALRWLGTCTDIHEQRTAEEERIFLDELDARMRAKATTDGILNEVVKCLGEYLHVTRCGYAEKDNKTNLIHIIADYAAPGVPALNIRTYTFQEFSAEMHQLHALGITTSVSDVLTDPRTQTIANSLIEIGYRASLVVPIMKHDENVALIGAIEVTNPREWKDQEIDLMETVAKRTWLAVENARLHRERVVEEVKQKAFVRDILSVVTNGRLQVCHSYADLPQICPQVGDVFELNAPSSISALRHHVRDIALASGFDELGRQDLMTAVGEAAMNAIVHASRAHATIHTQSNEMVQVWIFDEGSGIPIESLHRATLVRGYSTASTLGHGFKMIIGTIDRVFLFTRATGTTVVLEKNRISTSDMW